MAASTRPKRIQLPDAVYKGIEKHAYSNLSAEVGGMLFGTIAGGKTDIVGFVPALKASADQLTLTFTHEVWDEILVKGEKQFPGKQIVGWYHTHPSFGIFLSDYDEFIQNNFFSQPGQVALVIDPIAGRLGWFEKKGKGIGLLSEEDTIAGPKQAKAKPQMTVKRGPSLASTAAITAILSSAATFGVLATLNPMDSADKLQAKSVQLQDALSLLLEIESMPQFLYTATEGETLESIAIKFFRSPDGVSELLAANPDLETEELKAGRELLIVMPVDLRIPSLPNVGQKPTPEEKK
jgi:proteasome lid subunit RPN8/RPN11